MLGGKQMSIRTKLVFLNGSMLLVLMAVLLLFQVYMVEFLLVLAIAGSVFIAGVAGSYVIGTLITNRIALLTTITKNIAEGDLQQRQLDINTRDEVGQMAEVLADMLTNLGSMVGQITETALSVNSASSEILAASKRQEHNSAEQASAVEEIQRTMESLLASSRQIAESTQAVFANAEKTLSNNRLIAERIENLNAQTQRITEILEAIKDIADKSDLLALNASLEGTKAGEAGRGFSLVAAEMRRLAEDVMGSVKHIKQLVGDIRDSSHASVMAAEEGMKLSQHTTDSARQISLITQQQQSGTEQVTQSMDEISELLRQSVVGSKESTEASEELMKLSERLRYLVFNFKVESLGETQVESQL